MITTRDYLREMFDIKKGEKKKTNEEKLKNLFTLNSLYGAYLGEEKLKNSYTSNIGITLYDEIQDIIRRKKGEKK